MENSCTTLDLDLISKDVTLSKFWNKSCQELQSNLWLPHQTASPEAVLPSSSKLSNFMEEKLSFWKNITKQKVSISQPLLHFSLPFVIPSQGKETVSVTRKIRIFPKNKSEIFQLLSLARRSYNFAIEHFKETSYKDQLKVVELRRSIKQRVKEEWTDRFYRAEVAGEAVRKAFKTKQSIIRKRKRGEKCDYKFQSIKQTKQSFVEQRLTKRFMERFYITEEIPESSFGRTTVISFEYGRWFVNALEDIELDRGAENQGLEMVAIDPGIRTFATCYNGKVVHKYGKNFFGEKIMPLLLQVDKLLSKRKLFLNDYRKRESRDLFFFDSIRYFNKKIYKLRNRIDDLIADLHRRVAFDLVQKHDIILLPKFEVKGMIKKFHRKIGTKIVRSMLGLNYYKFKQTLKWMCKKYNKHFVEVNEAWTSKTMSWNGFIDENLGSKKTISDGKISVDRDINGARNIFLRAFSVASTDSRFNSCDCCG